MKRTICILAIMFFALGSMAFRLGAAHAATPQTKCPVLGNQINKSVYTDYQGKRIYFCCAGCPDQFKKDPAKYMKKMEQEGIKLEAASKK